VNTVWRLGLTGGIGSGKSTVAQLLAQRGASLIDADAHAHQATALGGKALHPIAHAFGARALTPEGELDREWLREHVYSDAQARLQLEAIVHPIVHHSMQQQASTLIAQGAQCLVFDIPLLSASSRWRCTLDRVVVVDCSPATQMLRVQTRNGWSTEMIEKIMAAQPRRKDRLALADVVIFNDGISLAQLDAHVQQIAAHFGL
jgi:dephospho-CoA kinase